jgi:hypothetical protein
MRRADNTIVFGSSTGDYPIPLVTRKVQIPRTPSGSLEVPPSMRFPDEMPRRLAEDLVDEKNPSYMRHPERGLAFAAVSLTLVGIAAAGTYFFFGSRAPWHETTVSPAVEPISKTTVTRAEIPLPEPLPSATPAPVATPKDLPWNSPPVDAVKAPPFAFVPKARPAPQIPPMERKQAVSSPLPKARDVDPAVQAEDRAAFPPSDPPPAPTTDEPKPPAELQQFELKQ